MTKRERIHQWLRELGYAEHDCVESFLPQAVMWNPEAAASLILDLMGDDLPEPDAFTWHKNEIMFEDHPDREHRYWVWRDLVAVLKTDDRTEAVAKLRELGVK